MSRATVDGKRADVFVGLGGAPLDLGLKPVERGIPFSRELVLALLAHKKTQTRRAIKDSWWRCLDPEDARDRAQALRQCPYGRVGDHLWVREALRTGAAGDWQYDADKRDVLEALPVERLAAFKEWEAAKDAKGRTYCHARFLPRVLSRITLQITDIRIQRVQEICEKDAIAEGVTLPLVPYPGKPGKFSPLAQLTNAPMLDMGLRWSRRNMYRWAYSCLWDEINGKGSWQSNPWVWAISFGRV